MTRVTVATAPLITAAQSVRGYKERQNVSELLADTLYTYQPDRNDTVAPGDIIRTRAEGFSYEVLAAGASGDVVTAGGVKLRALKESGGGVTTGQFGAVADGATDDSASLVAAVSSSDLLILDRRVYRVNSQVAIPASVSVSGAMGSRYANPSSSAGGKILSAITTAQSVIYRAGTLLQSLGGGLSGVSIGGHDSINATNLTGVNVHGLTLHNVFNEIIENLTVEHFNGATALLASGQCNKLTFLNPRVLSIGTYADARSGFGTDYGAGINIAVAPDSEIINGYVEGVGTTGITIGDNSKIIGGFIDLCRVGVSMSNDRPKITSGTSIKYHRRNGVGVLNARFPIIENSVIVSCNTDRALWSDGAAACVAMQGNVTGLKIHNVDFRHMQTWRGGALPPVIRLGPDDGSTCLISECAFGDVVSGGQHIADPNGVWAAGRFSLRNFSLTMGASRIKLQEPVAFEEGLTVNNQFFTVTEDGKTYVANGRGKTFPWVTTASFVADDWVELDALDARGLFVPAGVRTDIGQSRVTGTGSQTAITAASDVSISGVVDVLNCSRFMAAGAGTIGPKFRARAKPTTLLTCTTASSTASIRGWQFELSAAHTGSGSNEYVDIETLPARASGRVTFSTGIGGTVAFVLSANIQWDGTTLTVSDRACSPGFFGGAATFANNGGQLAVEWSSASARSGVATVEFDGLWTVAA